MTHRTRNVLVGSSLITAVGLCTGLVAYYNGALPIGRAPSRTELAYVPADVETLAFADVAHIMKSPFRQKLRDVMPTGVEKDRLLEETGVNVESDVDSVIAGIAASESQSQGIALMRGRFVAADIERRGVASGASVQTYAGKRLLVRLVESDSGAGAGLAPRAAAVAFLEPGLIALGDEQSIKRGIDAAAAGRDITSNDALMRLVDGVAEGSDAWVVSRLAGTGGATALPEQLRGQLNGVEWISIAAKIDRDVLGTVRAEAADDKAGEELRSVVNGALAAARMVAGGKDRAVDGILNTLTATGTGRTVELSFTVPMNVLDAVTPSTLGSMMPSLQ